MAAKERQRASSGSPYEPQLGISRAVRAGGFIAVAGTAPLGPDGKTVGKGDVVAQAERCWEIIGEALRKLGADLSDVVRTRIILTRIEDWEKVGEIHGRIFRDIRPVTTVIQVVRFPDPDWLVEFEVDAVVGD